MHVDLLAARADLQDRLSTDSLELNEELDQPILNAVEVYWCDFVKLATRQEKVREEMLKLGLSLDQIQRHWAGPLENSWHFTMLGWQSPPFLLHTAQLLLQAHSTTAPAMLPGLQAYDHPGPHVPAGLYM